MMTKSFFVLLICVCLPIFGCCQSIQKKPDFALQQGDLLFQDSDCGPLCDAIERVTQGYSRANLTHVGIAVKDSNDNFVVIEAVSAGVSVTQLQNFLNRGFDAQHRPKTIVGRLKQVYQPLIPYAIQEAAALKGKPYDKEFLIDNNKYYCSELIYEIFLRANHNSPLFTLEPMTFTDPHTGSVYPAWQEYFDKLGIEVPQGRPGINPGGISRSPAITIVHAYGAPNGWEKETARKFNVD